MIFASLTTARNSDLADGNSFQKSVLKTKLLSSVKHKKRRFSRKMLKKTTVRKNASSRQVNQPTEQTGEKPAISEAKRAGTFDGDLRDLPQTKPIQRQQPKLEQPKIKPRVYVPKPAVKPQ
jgi:hypothetical protein